MKDKDLSSFLIDAHDLDAPAEVDEERFADKIEENEYDSGSMIPQIFWDLGIRSVPTGVTPATVNLFDLLKNGIGNTDVNLAVVFGIVLGFIRRFHTDDTIRLAWEQLHNRLNDVLCDASATFEKRRETWVREAEKKFPEPVSIEDRNSHCFQKPLRICFW